MESLLFLDQNRKAGCMLWWLSLGQIVEREEGSTTSLTSPNLGPLELGNGQIVIGGAFTTFTIFLSDVVVDELLFLEGALTMDEIAALNRYGLNFGQNGN